MPNDSDKPQAQGQSKGPDKATLVKAGVAVGIGSAAIVAALLYANRSKRGN